MSGLNLEFLLEKRKRALKRKLPLSATANIEHRETSRFARVIILDWFIKRRHRIYLIINL